MGTGCTLSLVLASLSLGIAIPVNAAVQPAVKPQAEQFDLRDVRLLEGPFQHAQKKDAEYLLTLETDRLLAWFRKEAGLEPKAPVYGGWEIKDVAGHSAGHYLSACAMMWQATGDRRFLERVNYVVTLLGTVHREGMAGAGTTLPGGARTFGD